MILTPNGFHKFPRVPLSWRGLPLQHLSTSNMDGKSLFCTRHLLSRRTVLPRPSVFSQPPFCLARYHSSNTKLTVWSSYFQNLSPTHRQNLLVEKTKQKSVHYQGWSYFLLKRLRQGGQLTHSLFWVFGWFLPSSRLLFFLLDPDTSSSFCPCTHSPHSLG